MADVMLTLGGPYRYGTATGLCHADTYQKALTYAPSRIAGEYMHGFFTAGNSFNPMFSEGQADAVSKAKVAVGDFIGLFKIPSYHTIVDAAYRVIPVQYERGYAGPANTDGLVFTYEARIFNAETLEKTGTLDFETALSGIAANTAAIGRSPIKLSEGGYFVKDNEFVVLGLKVEALPSDKTVSLADVTGRVEISAHVWDYEVPIHV